jgi:hypothetical protein
MTARSLAAALVCWNDARGGGGLGALVESVQNGIEWIVCLVSSCMSKAAFAGL